MISTLHMIMYLYIKQGCFNCQNTIYSERLRHSVPCERDIDDEAYFDVIQKFHDKESLYEYLYMYLNREGRLFKFKELYDLHKATRDFISFFLKILDSEPWSIQITWFKRLYNKFSFSMIAPTGTGKTTFIAVSSIYFSSKLNKKIYIVLPTTVLVEQVYERIVQFVEKIDTSLNVVAYLRKNKKEAKERIIKGEFDILITSNQFLSRNFDILKDKKFDIIFVDDVDAFFKGSKNIERVLILLGFTDEDINTAYEMIKAKRQGDFELVKKLNEKLEKVKSKPHGILILSSATGRIRGTRTKLYRELLNFTAGTGTTKIRNIIDTYVLPKQDLKIEVYKLVNLLGDGIVIFVTREQGVKFAKELYEFLRDRNVRAGIVVSEIKGSTENIKKFANKELNVLIGIAHFYGLLVRGLDLPTRVKYVIFTGIPKIRINLTRKERNANNLMILANILLDILPQDRSRELKILLRKLQRAFRRLSSEAFRVLSESFERGTSIDGWLENLRQQLERLYNIVSEILDKEDIIEKLKNHPDVSITISNGDIWLNLPDIKTYIQASGRSSRLYAGGITKGLSIILVDDEKLLRSLERKMKLYFD